MLKHSLHLECVRNVTHLFDERFTYFYCLFFCLVVGVLFFLRFLRCRCLLRAPPVSMTSQYPPKGADNLFTSFESLKQCAHFVVMNPALHVSIHENWIFNGIISMYILSFTHAQYLFSTLSKAQNQRIEFDRSLYGICFVYVSCLPFSLFPFSYEYFYLKSFVQPTENYK